MSDDDTERRVRKKTQRARRLRVPVDEVPRQRVASGEATLDELDLEEIGSTPPEAPQESPPPPPAPSAAAPLAAAPPHEPHASSVVVQRSMVITGPPKAPNTPVPVASAPALRMPSFDGYPLDELPSLDEDLTNTRITEPAPEPDARRSAPPLERAQDAFPEEASTEITVEESTSDDDDDFAGLEDFDDSDEDALETEPTRVRAQSESPASQPSRPLIEPPRPLSRPPPRPFSEPPRPTAAAAPVAARAQGTVTSEPSIVIADDILEQTVPGSAPSVELTPDSEPPTVVVAEATALATPSPGSTPPEELHGEELAEEVSAEELDEPQRPVPPPAPQAGVRPPPAPPAPPNVARVTPPAAAVAVAVASVAPLTAAALAAEGVVPPPEAESKRKKRTKVWWEEFFNDDYLRTVRPPKPEQVVRQCNFLEYSLGLQKGATILDVGCGLGLQAVELAARGYLVVGLDLSLPMLSRAADEAQDREIKMNFLHGDMREMTFDGAFDAVLCLGTTFGYFDDDNNRQVLERMKRALKPQGLLLLDVVNRDFVVQGQPNLVWFEGDGCICMEETQFNYITSRLHVKRTVILEDGRQRENEYAIRLYPLHEVGQVMHQMGFRVAEVSGMEATPGVYFGATSPRLIILAERRVERASGTMPAVSPGATPPPSATPGATTPPAAMPASASGPTPPPTPPSEPAPPSHGAGGDDGSGAGSEGS